MEEHHLDTSTLFHKESLEQRARWQVLACVLMFVVVIETILVGFMSIKVAEKREVVRYVEFSTKGNFGFKVLPESNINISQKKLLIEQQLQQYVTNRVSNVATRKNDETEIDSNKFNFVAALSSKAVAEQVQTEMMKIYENAEFITRDIFILSYSEIEDRKYRFDFKTIDTFKDEQVVEQRWVVHVKYDLVDPNDIKANEHKELNPLGVKVTYYRGDIDRQQKINITDAVN